MADLKGKKVALNKGSNVHYFLIKALEQAGIAYKDVNINFLPPADARAAFESGAVDAWAIWDPFYAAAQAATEARTLADGTGLVANHQFFLSEKKFTADHPQVVDAILASLEEIDAWAKDRHNEVAAELSPKVGIPAPILKAAVERLSYGLKPIDEAVIAEQQKIADTFFELGLLPKAIKISDVIRKPTS